MNPIGWKLTPRFAAKAEVERMTAMATTPSVVRDFLMVPPFPFA